MTGEELEGEVSQQIKRRLVRDLKLDENDVAGVMAIVDEEVGSLEYTLEQWACDRCGQNIHTATKGDEKLCNACIFDRPSVEGADG